MGVFAVPEGVYAGRVPGQVGERSVRLTWSWFCTARRGGAPAVPSGSVDVNGTPDGRYVTGKRGAAVARGSWLSVVVEFCLALAREPIVDRTVNSWTR